MQGRNSHIHRLLIFISIFLCLLCGILFTQSSAGPSGNSKLSVTIRDTEVVPEATPVPTVSDTAASSDSDTIPATSTPTPTPEAQKASPEAENGVWTANGSDWLFMVDGTAYTGWLTDTDGKRYYFNKNGIMQRRWLKLKRKTYYLDEDGILQTGTFTADGKKYKTAGDGSIQK